MGMLKMRKALGYRTGAFCQHHSQLGQTVAHQLAQSCRQPLHWSQQQSARSSSKSTMSCMRVLLHHGTATALPARVSRQCVVVEDKNICWSDCGVHRNLAESHMLSVWQKWSVQSTVGNRWCSCKILHFSAFNRTLLKVPSEALRSLQQADWAQGCDFKH